MVIRVENNLSLSKPIEMKWAFLEDIHDCTAYNQNILNIDSNFQIFQKKDHSRYSMQFLKNLLKYATLWARVVLFIIFIWGKFLEKSARPGFEPGTLGFLAQCSTD